jgi:beta-fructofuranosidase
MFTEMLGSRKVIGDVDILYHQGLYHLFHLVLPNHDFIAHAVSTDAVNWRRVSNAIFIGDPGSWDDLMLWTMHVSADPYQAGRWRMFYTGLSRRDQGNIQRVGMAVSDDLYHWQKTAVSWLDLRGANDPELVKQARSESGRFQPPSRNAPFDASSCFPLEAHPEYYESRADEGRHWVSFRDPYYYHDGQVGWLLVAGRVKEGPIVRRGCVALMEEVSPGIFEARPPLFHPRLYDDIEVPNLLRMGDDSYLIGSIREDAKIRYWHTDKLGNPWKSYHDNVLMAQGNYAGRVCRDDKGWLLWNFYSKSSQDRGSNNLLPPPKRLVQTKDGLLRAKSFEGLDAWIDQRVSTRCIRSLREGLDQEQCSVDGSTLDLSSESGFHAFVYSERLSSLHFRGRLRLQGQGKCGLVFRIDPETHDGYYLSLDLLKNVAQLRSWGTGEPASGDRMMEFAALQSGFWYSETPGVAQVELIAFGSYIELSIDGRIILSLADQRFTDGLFGVYLETAHLQLTDVELRHMRPPFQSDDHLASG